MDRTRRGGSFAVFAALAAIVVATFLGSCTGTETERPAEVTKEKPSYFSLELETVKKFKDGSMKWEERDGDIIVHVVDRFGDGHLHRLFHPGVSKAEALKVLAAKQAELAGRK